MSNQFKYFQYRTLNTNDCISLLAIYSDAEAMKYRSSQPMRSIEDAHSFIQNQLVKTEDTTTIRKAVVLKETNTLIGSIMLRYFHDDPDSCLIGYSIGKMYWNKGYGKQIIADIIHYLKIETEVRIIQAWTIKENIASQKILEHNNFIRIPQSEYPESYLYQLTT